ncbi:MAG TPA: hypothetical protein PK280_09055 [Planctomycetota bacterium]|nr:hypothetical protein [Planctomycetota bacterium]
MSAADPKAPPTSPYPRSKLIKGIRWLSEPLRYPGSHGDTWSCTWADDGHIYSTADDCHGIEESNNSNLAVFRVEGAPPEHRVALVNPMDAYGKLGYHDRADSWKADGLICVDGVLYMAVSQHSGANEYGDLVQRTYDASIIKSTDHGRTWSPKRRDAMFPSPRFSTPFFVQFGRNYEGAMDGFVYAVSGTSWNNGNYLTLGRVPREKLGALEADDWEMYSGLSSDGEPAWKPYRAGAFRQEQPVFKFRGSTSMTGMHYVPAVDRFLLPEWAYVDLDGPDPWARTFLHLYEAPKPWGPWSLVHVEEDFGKAWYNPSLPAKWFEDGGQRMWMVCGGDFTQSRSKEDYAFFARKLELVLA